MELPKSVSEFAIWVGMQFPVLGAAALLAWWTLKYADRLHERQQKETQSLNDRLLADKDK